MRGKKCLTLAVVLIFVSSLMTAVLQVLAQPPEEPWVKIYVDPYPVTDPGTPYPGYGWIDIYIETHGITEANGITGWGFNLRTNINSISFELSFLMTATSPYSLWYFARAHGDVSYPLKIDPIIDEPYDYARLASEQIPGDPSIGADDAHFATRPLLATFDFDIVSDIPTVLDFTKFEYRTVDGWWHPVDIIEDGIYKQQPTFMSNDPSGPFDPASPIGSRWHELYPVYSNYLEMIDHVDNGDGAFGPSDQIALLSDTDGLIYWYHVDAVTVTIHFTFKTGGEQQHAEPYDPERITPEPSPTEPGIPNMINTTWHMIYPDYCRPFKITSHEDNDADGTLDPSEQFDFVYLDDPAAPTWAHLDSVSTDLVLSFKYTEEPQPEFPLGMGLIMAIAPMIAVIYLWRRKKVE